MTRTYAAAAGALAALVFLVGVVGYGIGVQVGGGPRMSDVHVFRDVPAQVGDDQVSASVDGIWYGFRGEVPWIDVPGGWHEGGWPACLPKVTETRVTFGGALIYGPGMGFYRILWVDCRRPSP